jgi:predicted O-methyltransferase YrrM
MSAELDRQIFHPGLEPYLKGLLPNRPPVLLEMEARAATEQFPIVGPVVGQLFYLLARLGGARSVFELGSGFGYSTAWFAMGVRDNGGGEVHHAVWDEGLSASAREYLDRLGLGGMVKFHVGEAVETLRRTGGTYDIIFNDIEKHGYPASFPVMKQHLVSGGIMLVDNVLWSGRVFEPAARDSSTAAIRELTTTVFADPDFTGTIIPLRDGVLVARKR